MVSICSGRQVFVHFTINHSQGRQPFAEGLLADRQSKQSTLYKFVVGLRRRNRYGERLPTLCFYIGLGNSDPPVSLRFTTGYAHLALRA
ncbi:MAG: hypothetical protein LBU34_16345 [Planctomycetaceae bacterium]|nr:hypothetical protein [Planctomycetaceae bacterium]